MPTFEVGEATRNHYYARWPAKGIIWIGAA